MGEFSLAKVSGAKALIGWRSGVLGFAALACTATSVPALAQDSDARLRKIEAEVRALQRQVFNGTNDRFFQPEINNGETQPSSTNSATPSSSAVTDILARLDSLEAQISRMTAQSEENRNAINLLQEQMASLNTSASAPALAAAEEAAPATSAAASQPAASRSVPATSGPSAERLARVQAIAKPQSDDAGDDEYSYGFRLWNAGLYPEARQQLEMFIEQHPNHWRSTFGMNLLGRAFLDDGMANEAASWFVKNYQADKNAARAGDSLLYLSDAMIAIDDTRRACIALAEFGETYPALATGRLQSKYEANTAKVSCN